MSASSGELKRIYLLHGEDPSLVGQALSELLSELAALEGYGPESIEEYSQNGSNEPIALGAILDACRTPAFLTTGRAIVLRDAEELTGEQNKALAEYLAEPMETTVLIISFVGRRVPVALARAAAAHGEVRATQPVGRERGQWFNEHLHASNVKIDQSAASELQEHLGEDLSRLEGILETLQATYGPGAHIHRAELEPFLGQAGGVAPWDLTDALDSGDAEKAITALHRLLEAGERHPLALMASLHRHYAAMLALDGSGAGNDQQASAVTGLAPFPARKSLAQARRLGHDRIARAIALLAGADLDLRGQIGWSGELVLEVLVARLAQNARLPSGQARRSGAERHSR